MIAMDRLNNRDTTKSSPSERGTWTSDVSEEVLTLTANRHSRRLRRPIVLCLLVLAAGLAWTATAPNALADSTPPDIQVDVDPAPNANGWHNTDVTVTWTISDDDGFTTAQDCSNTTTVDATTEEATNQLTSETSGTTLTCEATDNSDDGTSTKSVTIRIDKTSPQITGVKDPAANARGWNDDNEVDVTFGCSDVGSVQSGIDTDTTDSVTTLTNEGADQTVTSAGDCVDQAGNAATAETVIVNIDRTAPDVSSSQSPVANANGWNNTDVEVTWTVNDGISGVISLNGCGKTSLAAETAGTTIACTATDAADNETTASRTVKIDKTRPLITGARSPGPNEFGWNNEPVAVSFACADAGSVQSGVNDGSPISVNDVASNDRTLSNEGEGQSVTSPGGDCVDHAGNPATNEVVEPINIDTTKPVVTSTATPESNDNQWWNEPVTIQFFCTDPNGTDPSGIATDTLTDESRSNDVIETITKPGSAEACTDRADNEAEDIDVEVQIDRTRPVITGSRAPQANANGWNDETVQVTFTCADDAGSVNSGINTSDAAGISTNDVSNDNETLSQDVKNSAVTTQGEDCIDEAGNAAFDETVGGINIDTTDPLITGNQIPTPNANGWNNTDVEVTFDCFDTGAIKSGINANDEEDNEAGRDISKDSVTGEVKSDEGIGQTATNGGECVDQAGNEADDVTISGIDIDKTKPVITPEFQLPDGSTYTPGDWTNQAVSVSFTCADTGSVQSGVTGANTSDSVSVNTVADDDQTVNDEGDGLRVRSPGSHCIDKAGNQASDGMANDIRIDKTEPVITAALELPDGSPYTPGHWTNNDVTVTFSCNDTGTVASGIKTDTVAGDNSTLSSEGTNLSVTGLGSHCQDNAGNQAADKTVNNVKIDKTTPQIIAEQEPAANAAGWNVSDVAVSFDCTDTGSVQSGRDNDATTLGGDRIVSQEGQDQSVSSVGDCVDRAGNEASDASIKVSIDKTPPTVDITDNPSEITEETTADFTFDPTDSLSGVDAVECRLDGGSFAPCDGNGSETLTGLAEGQHTFEVRAVDVAGNTGNPASFTWSIIPSDPSAFTVEIADGPPQDSYTANTTATFVFSVNIAPVTLDTECRVDGVGSFTDCTSPHSVRSLGEGQHTFEVRAVTPTGQRSPAVSRTWNVDLTSPVLDASVSPAPNANGWHAQDVTVEFSCSDPTSNGVSSGVDVIASGTADSHTGTLEVTLSEEAEGQSRTGVCDDVAGNRSTETVSGINIDKTRPEITGARRPLANDHGWNNSEVTVRFECTNPGPSRIVTDTVAGGTVSADGESQSVTSTGDCIDAAGNEAAPATVGGINIDRTAPLITGERDPAPNSDGWNNEAVTVSFACTDTGNVQSGIGVDTVSKSTELTAEGADQTVTSEGSCIDRAGNPTEQADISFSVDIDLTPPAVSLSAPADGDQFERGAEVAANFLTDDDLSGIKSVNSPVPNGSLIDTGSLGEREFTVTAVDRADNTTTVTHTYQVLILPPPVQDDIQERIEEDLQQQLDAIVGDPEFEPGDVIELCLSFEDSRAERLLTEAPVDPTLFRTFEDRDPEKIRDLAGFDSDDDRSAYCLAFSTTDDDGEPLPAGTYDVVIAFGDGTAIRINFGLPE